MTKRLRISRYTNEGGLEDIGDLVVRGGADAIVGHGTSADYTQRDVAADFTTDVTTF